MKYCDYKIIIDNGANVNSTVDSGHTALFFLTGKNDSDENLLNFQILLEAGANPNVMLNHANKYTLSSILVKGNKKRLFSLTLPHLNEHSKKTAVVTASGSDYKYNNDSYYLDLLEVNGADIYNKESLGRAIRSNNEKLINRFINLGELTSNEKDAGYVRAAGHGDIDTMDKFSIVGVSQKARNLALKSAAEQGNIELVRNLLPLVPSDEKKYYAMFKAVRNGHYDSFIEIYSNTNVSQVMKDKMLYASVHHLSSNLITQFLLNDGADKNAQVGVMGKTALAQSFNEVDFNTGWNDKRMRKLLVLIEGEDLYRVKEVFKLIMKRAAQEGKVKIVDDLLKTHILDKSDIQMALNIAVHSEFLHKESSQQTKDAFEEIVNNLISNGANPSEIVCMFRQKMFGNNRKCIEEETLLMTSIRKGNFEMAQNLLQKGADPNYKDELSGRTVRYYAEGYPVMEKILDNWYCGEEGDKKGLCVKIAIGGKR